LVASNGHPGDLRGHPQISAPSIEDGGTQNLVVHAPHVIVTPEAPIDPPAEGNPDDVARVIRQNLSGIRWCYNEGIRNNPTLSGRIEVHFTLGTAGRIVGGAHIAGFDGAPAVRECIAGRFRSMVFAPSDSSATYTFPFQFSPGG
jgi:hypothetical protein